MACENEAVYAVAKYDYVAADAQELSIKKAERLIVLDESFQWWKVQNVQGQSGIVPSNYLKKYKPSLLESLRNTIHKRTVTCRKSSQNVIDTKEDLKLELFRAVAIYNYDAQKNDEMSLIKGDIIAVQKQSSDGWWYGWKISGASGWFPSNYVKLHCKGADSTSSVEEGETSLLDDSVRFVVALFSYSASNCDELSFDANEQLKIIDDAPVDGACARGWYRAQNAQGIVGLVPKAYVSAASTDLLSSTSTTTSFSTDSTNCCHTLEMANIVTASDNEIEALQSEHVQFDGKDWFVGKTSRAECEQEMNQNAENGDFIIRASETNIGEYTLTLKTKQRIKHFRIKVERGNYLIGQQEFHSLDDLIEHYKKHAIYRLGNEKVFLNKAFAFNRSQ